MKKLALYLAGALLVLPVVPQIVASAVSPAARQQQTQTQAKKTFTGTVKKDGDTFVLNDPGNKVSYFLDDARKASQFEGKKVKVTGTVDMASNTIHIDTIEEAA